MTPEQFKLEAGILQEMLYPVFEDEVYELVFGYGGEDGQYGWWLVTTDYPSYALHFLAEGFGGAEHVIKTEYLEELS